MNGSDVSGIWMWGLWACVLVLFGCVYFVAERWARGWFARRDAARAAAADPELLEMERVRRWANRAAKRRGLDPGDPVVMTITFVCACRHAELLRALNRPE